MSCPRFDSCNAPICPMDPHQKQRVYLSGEAVCLFMLEHVKPDGEAKIKATIGGDAAEVVGQAVEWAKCTYGPMQKRLNRASRTPSRLSVGAAIGREC